jgi:electron transport complex protein RnfB
VAYTIIETCMGCTACTKCCPTDAISGTRHQVHVIDPRLCIDCGVCGVVCPTESVLDETGNVCPNFPRRPRKEWPRAIVIEENCIGRGCELCIERCPFDALSLGAADRLAGDFFGVVVVNERKCTGCRLCEEACGWNAIYVYPPREMLKKDARPEDARPRAKRPLQPFSSRWRSRGPRAGSLA